MIRGEWMNYSLLNEVDLRDILAEQFVREYKKQVKALVEEGADTSTLTRDFETKLSLRVNEVVDRKMRNMKEELENTKSKSQTLESKLTEEIRIKKVFRYVSGILAAIVVLLNCGLLGSGQMELTVFSVIYLLGSLVVAGVLLMIAIAYERVEVALKVLLKIGKE